MLRMLVGRLHVSTSNKNVIKYVISRLKNKEQTFWKMSKKDRRNLMQACISEHKENQDLYTDVINGRF